jgi:hypothetical protein
VCNFSERCVAGTRPRPAQRRSGGDGERHVPGYRGGPHKLTAILAQHRANIVRGSYNRGYHRVTVSENGIDITMETRGPEHTEPLSALNAGG